ncbi:hypothetical protein DN30_1119 [Vibrio cholerae]|nr:hypothetical protein DN30_1119 [Vibrio cholerae]
MALFVVHLTQLRRVTEYPILFDSCLFFLIDDLLLSRHSFFVIGFNLIHCFIWFYKSSCHLASWIDCLILHVSYFLLALLDE